MDPELKLTTAAVVVLEETFFAITTSDIWPRHTHFSKVEQQKLFNY